MKNVLFVCVENSCRSQMAEALGKIYGKAVINSYSSGSRPSGVVNEKAIVAMKEIGYDLSSHVSKSLDEIPQIKFDYVITMGCGDECPYVLTKEQEDWKIPDPKAMAMEEFIDVRNAIKNKVIQLIERIKTSN